MRIRRGARVAGPLSHARCSWQAPCQRRRHRPGVVGRAAQTAGRSFAASPQLTGVSDATLPDALKVLWTYEAGDAIESSAAVVDGVVYVGSVTGELHAVNLA